jgi:hypothetical protein
LSGRGALCPQAVLDYVVHSRVDDVACSPGGSVVSLGGNGGQLGSTQAGSSQRFCVQEFWWVQDIPEAYRAHSAVLCVDFLLFGERKKEGKIKRKSGSPAGSLLAAVPQCLGFWGCYVS